MQAGLDNIWQIARGLSRLEKLKLMELLVQQLKIENEAPEESMAWEEMYGIGSGIWQDDAQQYVNRLREERF